MKPLVRAAFFVLIGIAVAAPQTAIPKPISAAPRLSRPHGSPIEWALKQINPQDIDYGQRIEELRQTAIDNTFHDYGFWADLVAVAVLGMMFLIVFWQDRKNRQMRFSTARVVTAYHNELEMARKQITRLSSEYSQARRILDEQRESSLVSRPHPARRENGINKDSASGISEGQSSHEQLLAENGSLKLQVQTLTTKWQEEQQKNRRLKGE
jgi:hypothetical protein